MMFCSQCGKQAEGSFCWNCGAKLFNPNEQQIQSAVNQIANTSNEIVVQPNNAVAIVEERKLVPYSYFKSNGQYHTHYGMFEVDEVHQLIKVTINYKDEVIFRFQDVLDAELVRNDTSVYETNTGSMIKRAAVGSLLAGSAGAIIAGQSTKREQKSHIEGLYIRIMLKNHPMPMVRISIIERHSNFSSDYEYRLVRDAETILAILKNAPLKPIRETAYEDVAKQLKEEQRSREIKALPPASTTPSESWRCPKCDYTNTSRTCLNCGTARPGARPLRTTPTTPKTTPNPSYVTVQTSYSDDDYDKTKPWFCTKCDYKNTGTSKSCKSCGAARVIETESNKKKLFGRK